MLKQVKQRVSPLVDWKCGKNLELFYPGCTLPLSVILKQVEDKLLIKKAFLMEFLLFYSKEDKKGMGVRVYLELRESITLGVGTNFDLRLERSPLVCTGSAFAWDKGRGPRLSRWLSEIVAQPDYNYLATPEFEKQLRDLKHPPVPYPFPFEG